MRATALVLLSAMCACNGGSTLNPLRPRLVADQREVRMGPVDLGVPIEGLASFSNPSDGEAHLRAHLVPAAGVLELVDTEATATRDHPARLRIRFTPDTAGDVTATLVVEHDAEPGDDGTRTLSVAIIATGAAPASCDDGNSCTDDTRTQEGCLHVPNRSTCDDGDACTVDDACSNARCVGRAKSCDDGIACTADTCNSSTGACRFEPVGARCDDGDPCTADICGAAGCTHETLGDGTPCGDTACSNFSACVDGACVGTTAPDGFPCSDGDACTAGDTCDRGQCVPGPVVDMLGEAILVREPASSTGIISGDLPFELDLVAPHAGTDSALLLWRGVLPEAIASCNVDNAFCRNALPCGDTGASMQRLHLTRAAMSGTVLGDAVLPLDEIYRLAALSAGISGTGAPRGSVAASAGVASPYGGVWGAAVVSFPNQCACEGDERITGVTCLAAGDALVVFHATVDGFSLVDVRWLGPRSPDVAWTEGTAHGFTAARLVAVTLHNALVTVAWATADLTTECGQCAFCLCDDDITVHTAAYEQVLSLASTVALNAVPVGPAGKAQRLVVREVGGSVIATLVSADGSVRPSCSTSARSVSSRGAVLVGMPELTNGVLGTQTYDALVADDALTPAVLHLGDVEESVDMTCTLQHRFSARLSSGDLTYDFPGVFPVAGGVGMLGAHPLAALVSEDSLRVVVRYQGAPHVMTSTGVWPRPGLPVAGSVLHFGQMGALPVVGTVAGDLTNTMDRSLVLTTVPCAGGP